MRLVGEEDKETTKGDESFYLTLSCVMFFCHCLLYVPMVIFQ